MESIKQYSVLMSVYKSEKADFLRTSMESMFNQTIPTNDFVLICDGPLTLELDNVINEMQSKYSDILHVIRFEQNHGLGYALQYGIKECKNELIARMDSDDISRPYRCEKELDIFNSNPQLSIVGALIEEFEGSPEHVDSMRIVPETSDEILKFAKTRSPFNHPVVMYKKSAVLDSGNYQDVRNMQDYYLWVAMLLKGYKGYNIQEPLLWMREDKNLFKRRSGKKYRIIQQNLLKYMKETGFISKKQYIKSYIVRTLSASAPNWLREIAYKKFLRK